MNWYPWLNTPYRQLIGQYQAGRGHHALLLHAAAGGGADALIYAISRWLICQQRTGSKSCGECHSCRLMLAETHPDWHRLQPEKGKNSIGVDAVRQVVEALATHAQQGGMKVVWLLQAEWLTEAAANALLKTLEEPPENTFFLLGCREPARLLATLRSRCLHWYLPLPQEAQSLPWLSRHTASALPVCRTALRLSGGAPLVAEQLLLPAQWQQRQALLQGISRALQQRDMLLLLPSLQGDSSEQRLHWLCTLLLDARKWQQGGADYMVNDDQLPLLQQLAQALSPQVLQQELQQWLACRHQLLAVTGVNTELLLTERLIEMEQRLAGSAAMDTNRLLKS